MGVRPSCPGPCALPEQLLPASLWDLPSWVTSSRLLDPSVWAFPLIRDLGIWTMQEACPGFQSSSLIITGHLCTVCLIAPNCCQGLDFILPCQSDLRVP